MCKSNITLLIQKLLSYRIIIPLCGCWDHLKFPRHFWHTVSGGRRVRQCAPPLRMRAASVGPVVLIELGVVVRIAVLHGDASGQDRGHVIPDWLALGLLLALFLHLFQLNPWGHNPKRTMKSLCLLQIKENKLISLFTFSHPADTKGKKFWKPEMRKAWEMEVLWPKKQQTNKKTHILKVITLFIVMCWNKKKLRIPVHMNIMKENSGAAPSIKVATSG